MDIKKSIFSIAALAMMWACSVDEEPIPEINNSDTANFIQSNPAVTHQEMTGFGDAHSNSSFLKISAFLNPAGNQVTYDIINPENRGMNYLQVQDKDITALKAYQSIEGNYFKEITSLIPNRTVQLLGYSVTTIVADLQ